MTALWPSVSLALLDDHEAKGVCYASGGVLCWRHFHSIIQISTIFWLPFCCPSIIDHFTCDRHPLLKLVCTDTCVIGILVVALYSDIGYHKYLSNADCSECLQMYFSELGECGFGTSSWVAVFIFHLSTLFMGFSSGSEVKVSACKLGDPGSIPGSGRFPGEGNGNPLQYSCLENPMDRGAWQAMAHGIAKSWTQLSTHVN